MKTISPAHLSETLQREPDARVLDVRTAPEHAALHIPGTELVPLDSLDPAGFLRGKNLQAGSPLYIVCQSGTRAKMAIQKFEKIGFRDCVLVDGGTQAWAASGLPVNRGKATVISVERQVRIVAGLMILAGVALGHWIHPGFFGLSAFVGAGLVMAGLTDLCPMAILISRMPWNRGPGASKPVNCCQV